MKRPKLGDSYFAPKAGPDVVITYIGKHKSIGQMIDVGLLAGAENGEAPNIHHLFYIGFSVSAAIKDGYLSFRGKIHTAVSAEDFTLRYPNFRIATKDIASWTIVHADRNEISQKLDDSHQNLPLAYMVNIELLNELIEKRWDGTTVL